MVNHTCRLDWANFLLYSSNHYLCLSVGLHIYVTLDLLFLRLLLASVLTLEKEKNPKLFQRTSFSFLHPIVHNSNWSQREQMPEQQQIMITKYLFLYESICSSMLLLQIKNQGVPPFHMQIQSKLLFWRIEMHLCPTKWKRIQ